MGNAVPWEGRGNQERESLGKSDRPELLAMEDRLGRKVKDKLFPEQLSSTCCTVSVRQGWPGARGSPPPVSITCAPHPACSRQSSSADITHSTKWRPAEQGTALTSPWKRLPTALSTRSVQLLKKSLSFLPSLSLCKWEGNILLKHLLDYGAEHLLCCLFLFQWSQQHCWKEATCFLEGNQAQNNTEIIKRVSQELHT